MMNDRSDAPVIADTSQQAFAFVQSLATELSRGTIELPAFPEAAMRVHRALADPKSSVDRIAQVVSAEPALAARLMSIANSAAFNTGTPLADLHSAIMRLGNNMVRSAAIAFAMAQLKSASELKTITKSLEQVWNESTQVAALCQLIARRTRIRPDEAFLTGLLHAMGKVYVLARAARRPELFPSGSSLETILQGWHATIGKAILQNWNMPESTCEAVADQDELQRKHYGEADLTDILVCAKCLAANAEDPAALKSEIAGLECFRQLRLGADDCGALLTDSRERIAALRAVLV